MRKRNEYLVRFVFPKLCKYTRYIVKSTSTSFCGWKLRTKDAFSKIALNIGFMSEWLKRWLASHKDWWWFFQNSHLNVAKKFFSKWNQINMSWANSLNNRLSSYLSLFSIRKGVLTWVFLILFLALNFVLWFEIISEEQHWVHNKNQNSPCSKIKVYCN